MVQTKLQVIEFKTQKQINAARRKKTEEARQELQRRLEAIKTPTSHDNRKQHVQ